MVVDVSEAKTHLSSLMDKACHGEKVVIAKNNLPMVELVVHRPTEKRKLGQLAGRLTVPDDFIDEDPEVCAMFYGAGQP